MRASVLKAAEANKLTRFSEYRRVLVLAIRTLIRGRFLCMKRILRRSSVVALPRGAPGGCEKQPYGPDNRSVIISVFN